MKVKIINRSANPLPEYATLLSAGMDLRANIEEAVVLHPLERVIIPTGLFVEIPAGHEIQIRPRSGLAIKKGITVINAPGTVDADYRGEIKVGLVNLSQEDFIIGKGERIAQMVLAAHGKIEWEEADELGETGRGDGGFGSTGMK